MHNISFNGRFVWGAQWHTSRVMYGTDRHTHTHIVCNYHSFIFIAGLWIERSMSSCSFVVALPFDIHIVSLAFSVMLQAFLIPRFFQALQNFPTHKIPVVIYTHGTWHGAHIHCNVSPTLFNDNYYAVECSFCRVSSQIVNFQLLLQLQV